ncbi:hypothetical protein ACFM35_00875 [Microbacterium sp. P01]|uniref:hypothetical protein n=1 Tax=Microbacterium sp. P01 TaxID=3366261 RepID=UPI00366C30E9
MTIATRDEALAALAETAPDNHGIAQEAGQVGALYEAGIGIGSIIANSDARRLAALLAWIQPLDDDDPTTGEYIRDLIYARLQQLEH